MQSVQRLTDAGNTKLRTRRLRLVVATTVVAIVLPAVLAAPAGAGTPAYQRTRLVSVSSSGVQGNDWSYAGAISGNGRYVAFYSYADNLVPGDTNNVSDTFLRDLASGKTIRLSEWVGGRGLSGGGSSGISNGGRYVAFVSSLESDREYPLEDVFVTEWPGRAWVGAPIAPARMDRNRDYAVYCYLRPRHAAGTSPVRIYRYRYVSGRWRSYGYVRAKAFNFSGHTRCKAVIRLPYRGRWRLRACHPGDSAHVRAWSTNDDYVTVR